MGSQGHIFNCQANSPTSKNIHFPMMQNREKQEILSFERLHPVKVWYFCLINELENQLSTFCFVIWLMIDFFLLSLIVKGCVGEDKHTCSVIVFTSLKSYCTIHQRAVRCDLQREKERVGEREGDGQTDRKDVQRGKDGGGGIKSETDWQQCGHKETRRDVMSIRSLSCWD